MTSSSSISSKFYFQQNITMEQYQKREENHIIWQVLVVLVVSLISNSI